MKKRHLKNWVKELIIASALGIVTFVSIVSLANLDKKAIDSCVKGGNSETFCRTNLLK